MPNTFGWAYPTQIRECAPHPTHIFQMWNLETGETAIVATKPYKLHPCERWSWALNRPTKIQWKGRDPALSWKAP